MVMLRVLCLGTVLSGVVTCAMEKESLSSKKLVYQFFNDVRCDEFKQIIAGTHHEYTVMLGMKPQEVYPKRFEEIAPVLKKIAQQSSSWEEILNDGDGTEQLLDLFDSFAHPSPSAWGFDPSLRGKKCGAEYVLRKELAVAVLGTSGAIACGKKYIQDPEVKKRLENFLFAMVYHGHRGGDIGCYLEWEDEDLDVVRAALDMGIDPCVANGCTYREGYGLGNCGMSLLQLAEFMSKPKIAALLRERGAVMDLAALITGVKL